MLKILTIAVLGLTATAVFAAEPLSEPARSFAKFGGQTRAIADICKFDDKALNTRLEVAYLDIAQKEGASDVEGYVRDMIKLQQNTFDIVKLMSKKPDCDGLKSDFEKVVEDLNSFKA